MLLQVEKREEGNIEAVGPIVSNIAEDRGGKKRVLSRALGPSALDIE